MLERVARPDRAVEDEVEIDEPGQIVFIDTLAAGHADFRLRRGEPHRHHEPRQRVEAGLGRQRQADDSRPRTLGTVAKSADRWMSAGSCAFGLSARRARMRA